ncbi:hypothetical protein MC885_001756 [Smutsia gigantea]|nr:hypothetical protein MC885_001756 [Smutsia gigantea]
MFPWGCGEDQSLCSSWSPILPGKNSCFLFAPISLKDKNQGELIPPVLRFTVTYLREKGLHTEGLFRRSASVHTVREIQRLYNQGKSVNFDNYGDIHIPARILKTFLRELPQPLLTFRAYEHILSITCTYLAAGQGPPGPLLLPSGTVAGEGVAPAWTPAGLRPPLSRVGSEVIRCSQAERLNLIWPSQGASSLSGLVPLDLFTELLIEYCGKVFSTQEAPWELGLGTGKAEERGPCLARGCTRDGPAGGLATSAVPP